MGGPVEGVCGRRTARRAIAAVSVASDHGKIVRARLHGAPDLSPASMTVFLSDMVFPGSIVDTDGWCGLLFYPLLDRTIQSEHTQTAQLYKGPTLGPWSVEEEDLLG